MSHNKGKFKTHPYVHFPFWLHHARLEDVGAEQGQEGTDNGHVLGSEVHAGARRATAAIVHLCHLVYQLDHRDHPVVILGEMMRVVS